MGCTASAKPLAVLLTSSKDTSQSLLLRGTKVTIEALNRQLFVNPSRMQFQRLCHEPRDFWMHRPGVIMQKTQNNHVQRDVVVRHHSHQSTHYPQHHQHVYGERSSYNVRRGLTGSPYLNPHRGIVMYHHRDAHRHRMLSCRCVHMVAEQAGAGVDMKPVADDAAWADLGSKMQVLRGGIAKGEALEDLKSAVDRLLPFAAQDDYLVCEACLHVAQSFAYFDEEPPKILLYAQRALRAYESHRDIPDYPRCLYLLGYAYFRLEDYPTAVSYFEHCTSALAHLAEIGGENDYCNGLKPEVQAFLGRSKMLLSQHSQAITHYRNFLELKEKILEPDDPDLGTSYLQAARGFRGLKDVEGALSAALKALDMYTKKFGPDSLEVAEVRSFLCGLYCDMGKYKESLAEADAARPILHQAEDVEEVAYLDFSIAECLQLMGRHPESLAKLEEVIKTSELTTAIHFNALLTAARACARTKKNDCVSEYCVKAQEAIRSREPSADAALSLALLALVYEEQRECNHAIDILKQAKSMLDGLGIRPEDVPAFAAADIDGKIGFLLLRVGKANEALPYLQYSLSKKKTFHARELLYLHFNLGAAYIQLRRFQEAPQQLDTARRYLSGNISGLDSTKRATMYHNLAALYKSCRRHRDAVDCDKAANDLLKMMAIEKGEEV
ncbi:hypothetical protein GOP47_0027043 [Adiantum capillus-veneris]|nr:hypothetical protein GOP47_0027043 [Adiantum capillus-veneris]